MFQIFKIIRVPVCSFVVLLSNCFSSLQAAEPSPSDLAFFENNIRPLLIDKCYKCHSHEATKLKGGLSLEFRETILKGGDTGAAIVPADPENSLLVKAIRYGDPDLQMPPKGEKLSDSQIADLIQWIKMGAPDPRTVQGAAHAKDWNKSVRDHWAFQPVKKPAVPEIANTWASSPVDKFILARLDENGMKPSPLADKRTLIRRATFDLIGLPPTLQETKNFVNDTSPEAFAKVVDRLLASPRYGERWGRFWLDIARYSDTKGDVKKNREDPRNPDAWTYRDYVIRAFNEDKPFNRFIVEQIAADKINLGTNKDSLTALGFLTLGDHFDSNPNEIINDRIDVVTKGTMGLTVTCARCHDHKFDPIPTKDYYSLHGIFASSREPSIGALLSQPKMTTDYVDYAKKYNALDQKLTELRKSRKKGNQKEVRKEEIRIVKEMTDLEINHAGAPPRAMVLLDSKPRDSRVFIRGEAENRGDVVPRQFLEILSGPNRTPFTTGSGRYDLALAIANPKNPLTPRVIVNRVWQNHFGEGFVPTPDDFGNQSAPPSHPELLDYLASRFMEDGWSIKKLHRLIMLSSVYQQSSDNNPRYAQKDPNNRLLWRANIQRLEFEAVRDSLLAIGGKLDETMYGKPVKLGASPYSTRRTIYGYIDRRNLPEVYNQFDFANPDISTGKRYETTVPQQSLFMMNSPLVVEQARNLIKRKDFSDLKNEDQRIQLLYELIYQRAPTSTEIKLGLGFIKASPPAEAIPEAPGTSRADFKKNKNKSNKKMQAPQALANISGLKPLGAWEKYAHALLQANEALFIN